MGLFPFTGMVRGRTYIRFSEHDAQLQIPRYIGQRKVSGDPNSRSGYLM